MKNKKPPPGATLIARLKEQRLAREAELTRKKEEAAQGSSPTVSQPPTPRAIEPAAGKESADQAKKVTSEIVSDPVPSSTHAATSSAHTDAIETVQVVEPLPEVRQAMVVRTSTTKDLIHREIDIDDLRPNTDDYFVLTDEIRLAGRFAAVGLIAQGLRLFRLRDAEIYKQHYQTFEDYCRKEHLMSATYAYRLIRMAEMAEQVASFGHASRPDNMPDPFEVMISLGHRHLLALLPLEAETAQQLLVRGIPVSEDGTQRVPLSRATEKQIRAALKGIAPGTSKSVLRVSDRRALVSEKQLIPALSKLVEMLEDWSVWLDGDPPPELEAARMGRGPLLGRLAKRFRAASGKIADALESGEDK